MSDNKPSFNKTKIISTHICDYSKNKNGMGGIATDKKTGQKFEIAPDLEDFALDKDEVEVSVKQQGSSKKTISFISQIIKRHTANLVGSIQRYKDRYLLKVRDQKFGDYLVIIKSDINFKIDRDEVFNTIITKFPDSDNPAFEVLLANNVGKSDDDESYLADLIKDAMLPVEFSHGAIKETDSIPEVVNPKEIANRVDLRNLPFVTIDGSDAKDFDDAVYCELKDNVFNLYVAIADVAHYVNDGTALERDAYLRGTSVYFPKRVIPMLPEKLSNGLCSLNPNVDRLVMCCQMKINQSGEILEYKVFNGVIHSNARLTYEGVEEWINNLTLVPSSLVENISALYLSFKALSNAREIRGAIDFDSIEPVFIFNDLGEVENIKPRVRLEAHKLIEECMLAANVCVADFLLTNGHGGLFRVHDKPTEEKFANLKTYLNSLAIKFDIKYEQLEPHHYSDLLHQVRYSENFVAIEQSVLRSLPLAIYSAKNIGHFGLSYKHYLHFTSPIRRYPDLLVHRVAKAIIAKTTYNFSHPLEKMGEQSSFTERRAEDLDRKMDSFYKCQYAKTHIGSEFIGNITSIVNFGIFVYLPDLLLDGLVHVTQLGEDYFVFDNKAQALIGKKTGLKFVMGQMVKVKIIGVDMVKLFIDFQLIV